MKEEQIKQAVLELLVKEGKFDLTLENIAQKAKICHTAIHYYFRTKDNLIDQGFREITDGLIVPRFRNLTEENLSLKEKVERYIDESSEILQKYPYLDVYAVTRFNENNASKTYFDAKQIHIGSLLAEISSAIEKGAVIRYRPFEFLIVLFSLTAYFHIVFNSFQKIEPNRVGENQMIATETLLNLLFNGKTKNGTNGP
ncbi:TetR/AcrR family transcriptional regulator [Sphingobacterium lactis]|uniref:TetR/AcrR family transcriptional regulator n=1 Tax=Sphingobacterium TaxID=28453 RepID=UPI00257A01D6|nr:MULTISPECIES: TetR family transcriptional regulator [Sphingobacterium]